jgi:hypothetical protein
VSSEKRKERRRPVSISAGVSGNNDNRVIKCKIVDASLSGCRLYCEHIELLPDSITLNIPGMDLPVPGAIVWRSDSYAGVRMMWQFSRKSEFQASETIKAPSLANKVRANTAQARPDAQKSAPFGLKRRRR